MSVPRKEKAYEKHAWILLFAVGTFYLLGAITHIVGAPIGGVDLGSVSTALANLIRLGDREIGIDQAAFSVLVMATSAFGYRKGARWTWHVLWIVPAFILASAVNNLVGGGKLGFGPLSISFAIIALIGLLLPYRKFFPKKQPVPP